MKNIRFVIAWAAIFVFVLYFSRKLVSSFDGTFFVWELIPLGFALALAYIFDIENKQGGEDRKLRWNSFWKTVLALFVILTFVLISVRFYMLSKEARLHGENAIEWLPWYSGD